MSETGPSATPLVWLMTDDRPGNRSQALGVARAAGLAFEEKRLAFNERQSRSNARLGATLETLAADARPLIAPPWPDLVIAAGRRVVPVARWVAQETGGRAKTVLVGRKTPDAGADLVVRAAYFKQAPSPRLFELTLPLTQVDAAALARARAGPDPLEGLASPRTVFLFGGPTGQHAFEDAFAERMAREVAAAVSATGGGLAILTSRRTPASAIAAIRRAAPEARVIAWSPEASLNPVLPSLARADLLVVTGESESMLAEGVASGRPLTIYPLANLPQPLKSKIRGRIADASLGQGAFAAVARRIMADGWVTPRRDLSAMHRLLETRGWAKVFDGTLNRHAPALHDESAALAARIRGLLG